MHVHYVLCMPEGITSALTCNQMLHVDFVLISLPPSVLLSLPPCHHIRIVSSGLSHVSVQGHHPDEVEFVQGLPHTNTKCHTNTK